MINGILQGLLLGIAITALPGAVILETMRRAFARKSVKGFLTGNFIGVGFVVCIVLFGLSSLLRNQSLSKAFYSLSACVLFFIGITSLITFKATSQNKKTKGHNSTFKNHGGSFTAGMLLAVANPAGVLFWIVTIGRYVNAHTSSFQVFVNCLSILLGAGICYALILFAIHHSHKSLSFKQLGRINNVFGTLLIGYGVFLLLKI
jgi:threonine/homoserine/homoserine lactone efflux protein